MVTIIIRDAGEPNVIKLTYENLWRELKNIPDAEIIVEKDWFNGLTKVNTKWVCFVEPDCLVTSGYFESLTGFMKKNPLLGHLAVLSTATAVGTWAVRFFGYSLGNTYSDGIVPNVDKKATKQPFYTIQVAYIPGALVRTKMVRDVIDKAKVNGMDMDLVEMSTRLSLEFWRKKWMVYIAPNSTYCSTETYLNDITKFDPQAKDLVGKFASESI